MIGIFLSGILTFGWLLIGHPPMSELGSSRTSIDLNSGDIHMEHFLGNWRIDEKFVPTSFSQKARGLGLALHGTHWTPIAQAYYPAGPRLNFPCAGADEECRFVAWMIDFYGLDREAATDLLARYMRLLSHGDVAAMRLDVENDLMRLRKEYPTTAATKEE